MSKMAAKRPLNTTSAAASVALENAVSGMRWKAGASVVSSVSVAVASEKSVKRPRKSASDATVASASSDGAARILVIPSQAASTHESESTACESACLRVSFPLGSSSVLLFVFFYFCSFVSLFCCWRGLSND